MKNLNIHALLGMSHSALQNYIVPGLQSRLLAERSAEHGSVRLFVNTRQQHHHIPPHSHRFDFQCLVLRGWVINMIFSKKIAAADANKADLFTATSLQYQGKPGQYAKTTLENELWVMKATTFNEGERYGMRHDEVHSIKFSHDAVVLFFEGPEVTDQTLVLEPFVDGKTVPTFKVEDWMFQRAAGDEEMF